MYVVTTCTPSTCLECGPAWLAWFFLFSYSCFRLLTTPHNTRHLTNSGVNEPLQAVELLRLCAKHGKPKMWTGLLYADFCVREPMTKVKRIENYPEEESSSLPPRTSTPCSLFDPPYVVRRPSVRLMSD